MGAQARLDDAGAILIQEYTYQPNMNFWQGSGYMFFVHESESKERGNVTAIRQDIMKKNKFELNIFSGDCRVRPSEKG